MTTSYYYYCYPEPHHPCIGLDGFNFMHFEDQMVSFIYISLSDEEKKLIIQKVTNKVNLENLG